MVFNASPHVSAANDAELASWFTQGDARLICSWDTVSTRFTSQCNSQVAGSICNDIVEDRGLSSVANTTVRITALYNTSLWFSSLQLSGCIDQSINRKQKSPYYPSKQASKCSQQAPRWHANRV